MKKALSLVLALSLVAGVLASCAPATASSTAPPASGSGSAAPAPQTSAEREKVNIRFSQFANSTDDLEGMKNDPIKKKIEETLNITLEYDTGLEGYDDRLQTELAVGNAPELFPTWGEADKIKKYVDEEAVHDLGAIINGDPARYPTLSKMINDPNYKAYNKMYLGDENKTYAIYSIYSTPYPQFNGVPAYNGKALADLNEGKVPATVDEFIAFTKKAAQNGMSGWYPYNVKLTNWGEINATIASPMGANILPPTDKAWAGFIPEGTIGTDSEKWVLGTVSDKSKEAVKVLADMYKDSALHNGIGVMSDDDDGYAQFVNNQIAAFGYGYGYYSQFHKLFSSQWKTAHKDAELGKDVILGTALQSDGNWATAYDTGTWINSNYFVPTSCDYPDRVLDLVEFLATNEGQNLIFRGIEGLTYTMDGEKVVYNLDEFVNINKSYGYADPDRCRYMWFSYLFAGGEMRLDLEKDDWWESATTPFDNTVEWASPEDQEIYQYALDQIALSVDHVYTKLPAYYTFVALPAELSESRNKMKEITNRYLSAMIGGTMDIDKEWPNYVKEYEAAGSQALETALNDSIKAARETYSAE